MMRVGSSVLGAGGIGVLVESSGVAHNKEDWMKLAGDREAGGRYWAYVTLVGGKAADGRPPQFYSCGMHALGFPDVITTLNPQGVPVSVGELREGDELLVLRIAKSVIPLSSSVTDPSVYPVVEKALGINLTDYALG